MLPSRANSALIKYNGIYTRHPETRHFLGVRYILNIKMEKSRYI